MTLAALILSERHHQRISHSKSTLKNHPEFEEPRRTRGVLRRERKQEACCCQSVLAQLNSEHHCGIFCGPLGSSEGLFAKGDEKIDLTLEEVPSSPGIPGSQGTAALMEHVLGTSWCAAFFYNHSQHWLSPGCLPGPAPRARSPLFISASPRNSTKGKVILFSSAPGALKHRWGVGIRSESSY